MNCFVNIDKNAGLTSADIIMRMKKLLFPKFGKFKIGHAGTLDPMATGVLPIACGEATKLLPFIHDTGKVYIFNITFGRSTATDDAEGETIETTDKIPTQDEIEKILPSFTGAIVQTPPAYSAIKIKGRRAYDLARRGEELELKPRAQHIRSLRIAKKISYTEYQFEVETDRGFYVRSIARDIALGLNSLGHASLIRRTKSGPFSIDRSITLDKLAKTLDNPPSADTRTYGFCLDMSIGLDGIPAVDVDEGQNKDLRSGRTVSFEIGDFPLLQIRFQGELSAIVKSELGRIKPVRVFNL